MNGYRRIEPQFCRGCGRRWTPGQDACPQCDEVLFRPAVAGPDPHGLSRLRAGLIAAFVVIVARWGVLLGAGLAAFVEPAWMVAHGAVASVAILAAPWWYAGGWPKSLRTMGRGAAWLVAPIVGVGVPLIGLSIFGPPGLERQLWMREAIVLGSGDPLAWLAALVVLIVLEEVLLRGLLFDGVASISGPRNAAIASIILFAMLVGEPMQIVFGAIAAGFRLWSGSVGPAVVVRVVASVTWLLYLHLGAG